jgi:hypothetical protein
MNVRHEAHSSGLVMSGRDAHGEFYDLATVEINGAAPQACRLFCDGRVISGPDVDREFIERGLLLPEVL